METRLPGKLKAAANRYIKERDYWLSQLSPGEELVKTCFPYDFKNETGKDKSEGGKSANAFETAAFKPGRELSSKLMNISNKNDRALHMVLTAGLTALLYKYTGNSVILVGTPIYKPDIDGDLINTALVLKNQPDGSITFKELLLQVRTTIIQAIEHQNYPIEILPGQLNISYEQEEDFPLFDVALLLENLQDKTYLRHIKHNMTVSLVRKEQSVEGLVHYNPGRYRRATIQRIIHHLQQFLTGAADSLDARVADIDILSREEKQQLLVDFNDTTADYPQDKTLHRMFSEQVERTPDRTALIGRNSKSEIRNPKQIQNSNDQNSKHHVTYRELNEKSDQLAYSLIEKGVRSDTVVGIRLERSIELIIGIMGILKANGAYLPIDPEYPEERINYMLKDSGVKILLTPDAINRVPTSQHLSFHPSTLLPFYPSNPASLAYIIYTSGSTGRPKGVLIEHGSVVNRLNWMQRYYPLDSHDVVLQKTPFTFDVSVWELFWWFFNGARLCLLAPGEEKNPEAIIEAVEKNRITTMHFVPSMFNAFLDYLEISGRNLRAGGLKRVFASGEALTVEHVEKFNYLLHQQVGVKLINLYGPTEATVDVSYFNCPPGESPGNIPIGKPIDNIRLYILDKELYLLPPGVGGELYISGVGLARGYLNRPGLTFEGFINYNRSYMSYKSYIPKKLYRTGDLARWLPDGNIEFLGRVDHQVKIRGFRIEPGEIERCLKAHEQVKEVVLTVKEKENEKFLCAYVVPNSKGVSEKSPEVKELRDYLSMQLPGYMIPAHLVFLERFPLTSSGKLDRKALPDPDTVSPIITGEDTLPTNEIERKLAEIFQKVLGRERIGIHENFFTIGGDSIKLIRVAARMRKAGYAIQMNEFFQYPTISRLAPMVRKLVRVVDQSEVMGRIPLIPIQAAFFQNYTLSSHHYNQSVMLYSKEGIDEEAVAAVFRKLQHHHDALRMTFKYNRETAKVIQTNRGSGYPFWLRTYDFREKSMPEAVKAMEARAGEIQASIDLEKGPLMKLGLFRLQDGDRLLIVIHHLVIDGVSWRILFEDLETLYQQYKKQEPLALPLKTDSYKTWSEKLSQYAHSKSILKEIDFWVELESLTIPIFEKDYPGEDNYVKDTDTLGFRLNEEETYHLLTDVNEAFGTEINDILLTALALTIKRNYGYHRFSVALEGHGREEIIMDVDISRTVGWFTSLYPVILDISYENDLSRQVKEIKETLRRVPHHGIGYGILKYLTSHEDRNRGPFKLKPQVCFNYLGQFDTDVAQMSFAIANESHGSRLSREGRREYEWEISGMVSGNRLFMSITYNKTQYKRQTIERLWEVFQEELLRLIRHCSAVKKRELTPSDLTYKKLSMEVLDGLSERYLIEDVYPLTSMQEGMLFHALLDPSSSAYFEQISYRVHGNLQVDLVKKSLNELVKRHAVLRTAFIHEYQDLDRPLQVLLKHREVDFYYEDSRAPKRMRNDHPKETYIREFGKKDRQRSFNLSTDALFRVSILQVDDTEYEFAWSFHHIVMDGWCTGILTREFLEIYTAFLENRGYRLPVVTPYRVYIQWLEKQDKARSRDYWHDYLAHYHQPAGLPGGTPINRGDKAIPYQKEQVVLILESDKTEALNRLAGKNHVTLNTILQAIWGVILSKYTGKRDVVFGAVVSGRPPEIPGVESMVGLFIHTIPVRIKFDHTLRFQGLLQKVQQNTIASEPHHYYSLAEIQSLSSLKQHLMDHIFVFENYPIAEQLDELFDTGKKTHEQAVLRISNIEVFEQANYDFGIRVSPGRQMKIEFLYNRNVHGREIIERVSRHLNHVVQQVLEDEERYIHQLTLLSAREKREVLIDFNETHMEFSPDKTLHGLFEEQVERTPDNIAVIGMTYGEQHTAKGVGTRFIPSDPGKQNAQLTYSLLDHRANQLACVLIGKGVQTDTIVAIMPGRSVEMIIGLLAILKAGGAYLPIDPGYPEERINYMLADSGVSILVTSPVFSEKFEKLLIANCQLLMVNEMPSYRRRLNNPPKETNSINNYQLTINNLQLERASLAYVIYTSGSTGKPKGVLIRHQGFVNLVYFHKNVFKEGHRDRMSQVANPGFDAMGFEVWPCLLHGAVLHIAHDEIRSDPGGMKEWLIKNHITISFQPTVMAEHLLKEEWPQSHVALRALRTAGDRLTSYPRHSYPFRFYNLYGPTEDTVWTTYTEVTTGDGKGEYPDIGKPIGNKRVYIVDPDWEPQPVYIAGELCISGIGLAVGYLNNPELTAEKFCLRRPGKGVYRSHRSYRSYISYKSNIYRTGDLTRWLPDGSIEFLGRVDHQVKLRGFRVEPGEIESRLLKHESICEAVVAAVKDRRGEKALCAYIIPVDTGKLEKTIDTPHLKEYLAQTLPDYMIPTYFVQLEKIPLTPNGKIDRNRLPAPQIESSSDTAPGHEKEAVIADIWQEVLQLEKVGIHDNFFDLGGNSMDIIRVNNRLKDAFGLNIPLVTLFRYPTIHALYQYLTKGETEKRLPHETVGRQPAGLEKTRQDIAVIGMSGRFPAAPNIHEFWDNLKYGRESISFFTGEELEETGVEAELVKRPNYIKARAFLEDKEYFDASFFGYVPTEAEVMDPQMRIFHECAWEALENAGYIPGAYDGMIGLYAGASNNFNWEALAYLAGRHTTLGQFALGQLTNKDFLSSRISYKLDLKGPVVSVQTACSTALVAIHMACRALISGECDMAMAGGITISGIKKAGYLYQEGMIMSPDGHCRAFAARAKGTVSGEGAGIVVLKPLKKAMAEGDHIYALVKGTAINNDGMGRVGFSAPGVEGQAQVIRTAQKIAGVEAESITYIETHGTATEIGDPIEIEALKLAFNTDKKGFCALGSIKTNVGHLDCAAGAAGFIKIVLALTHRCIPPSLHFEDSNPAIDFKNSPFYVNTEPKEWNNPGYPLRAGVSSFGIGGTNAHVILEESPAAGESVKKDTESREYQLILLSAQTSSALDKITGNLVEYLKKNPGLNLADAAYTLQVGRRSFHHRRMLVVSNTTEAIEALSSLDPGKVKTARLEERDSMVCFMFAGLGSQYVNMGRELYEKEPIFRQEMNRCFKILNTLVDYDIKEILYPHSNHRGGSPDSPRPVNSPLERGAPEGRGVSNNINQPEIAQVVIFIFEYALAKLLLNRGIRPHAMIGYSFGEYTAACIAGVFSLEDVLELVISRGQLLNKIPGGSMLSVPLDKKALKPLLPEELSLSIDNGPSCIVSGTNEAVHSFEKSLKKKGYISMRLQASRALHSHMMDPILNEFEKKVRRFSLNKPNIPYISNVTGNWISDDQAVDPGYWSSHLRKTVRFSDGVRRLLEEPGNLLVEIGPGHDLTALLARFTGDNRKTINLVRPPGKEVSDIYYLLNRIGRLWLYYGKEMHWAGFYQGEKRYRLPLPTYPFERQPYWLPGHNLTGYTETSKKRSPVPAARELADWFYIPTWSLSTAPLEKSGSNDTLKIAHTWLAMLENDDMGIGSLLVTRLRSSGHQVVTVKPGVKFEKTGIPGEKGYTAFTINPGKIGHYEQLFRELRRQHTIPHRVVHFWSLNREHGVGGLEPGDVPANREAFEKAQHTGFYSLLHLAVQLSGSGSPGPAGSAGTLAEAPFQITVVTNQLLEVTGEEELSPEKATLLGALKVIPQEHPHMRCRCIDIGLPAPRSLREEKLIEQLWEELLEISSDSFPDTVMAIRGDYRRVQTYTPLRLEEPDPEASPLKEKGVYLVTGGLGNIGYILAEYLARKTSGRLILTGRSFCPMDRHKRDQWLKLHPPEAREPENPVNQRIQKVHQLEALGAEVLVFDADVSNLEQMQVVIEETGKKWGNINGVIHAAGIVGGGSFDVIEKLGKDRCWEQFKSKVLGTLVLESVLQSRDLDFCWMMSSISAVLGGLRFAAYSAANCFVDAWVKKHNRWNRKPWKSVNWEAMEPRHTRTAFERILSRDKLNQVVVAKGGNLQDRIDQWIKLESLHKETRADNKDLPVLMPRPDLMSSYLEPRTPVEQIIVDTWKQLFGFKQIGIRDDFFELGGDSLKAVTVIARMHKALGVEVPLTEFFNRLTIENIAEYIKHAEKIAYSLVEPAETKEYYVLSSAQRRMYILHRLESDSLGYNETRAVLLEGDVDKNKFQGALHQLIRKHEGLRTSFIEVNETPVQRVHDEVEFQIEYLNGDHHSSSIIHHFVRPFDLSCPPLFRAALIKTGENTHVLVFDIHHIITDGFSHEILIKDFMTYYAHDEETTPAGQIHTRLQYKDYAEWQHHDRQQQTLEKQEKYWLERFKDEIPVLYLPYDYPRPEIQGFAGNTITFFIGKEETKKMRDLASKEEMSLFMLLLAVLNVFLSRTSSQEDIVVGTAVAGRRHENLQGIIGLFVNTLPLRNYPNDDKPFIQFLKEIKKQTPEAFSNQDYPFEDLVEKVSVNRDPGRNPLFDILLMFQNLEIPALEIPGLRLKPYRYEKQVSKFDITFTAFERDEEIHFSCEYSTKLFKEDTIQGFIDRFKRIVSVICRKPGERIGEIEILAKEEKRRLLFDMNQTRAEYPREKTLHALFEEQVERTPDRVALLGKIPNPKSQIPNEEASFGQINAFGEGHITYSELNERSGQLAHALIEKGVQTDTIAGIMMDHCNEMIIGILGILKAGGAYMPMDPQYPKERINYMLADSSAKVLVTRGFLAEEGGNVRRWQGEKIFLEPGYCQGRGEASSPALHQHAVSNQAGPANLAYVIYTSGTTGRPKGVMITHPSAVNYICWAARNYVKDEPVDFPLFTSISFDLTVTSIFTPLGTGNTIVVYGARNRENIIERIIDDNRVGVIKLTPAHLSLIRDKRLSNNGLKLSIKRLVLGGEKLETRIAHDICENFNGNIEIYNEYGPTETTVGCMIYKFDRQRDRGRSVPIGGPAANTRIYLLDKNQRPVPLGITGEIYISGTGVAAGYLNRPDLTSETFIINPFLEGSTCYRTADLARRRPDGNIEFLGRLDQQAKIRGFRVEPGEIQHHLLSHQEIKEAVVTVREDKTGQGYLCAYIVSNRELDPAGLREFLSHRLPDYMIPPYFVQMENIPLTPNGKVNQKALPEPEIKSDGVYNAPRDAVEKKLAAIWLDVLGLARDPLPASPGEGSLIGIDDNFFQLGGHSLKATRLTSIIHREFKVKIPLAELFKTPSIRSLAAYIKKANKEEYGSIEPVEEKEYYELSSAQKRLYVIHQVEPESIGYNMSVVLAVKEEIDLNKIKNIFARMIQRHESLRTSFMVVKGEPVQKVHYRAEFEIEYDDLQVTGEGNRHRREAEPIEPISAFIRPFDLTQVPLLRVGLIKEKEETHILIVDMHHIISDGISMQNLVKEFMIFYTDPGWQLPPLTLRYKDFAQWKNKLSRSTKIKEQENYWTGCFKGEIPVLQLPFDYPRPPVIDFAGEKLGFSLDEEATAVLKRMALEADVSLFMLLLTVYTIFLRKVSGQEDIVVGVPAAGRSSPELEPVIGMFINTLALRNFPTGEKTFLEFLNEVKENSLQAFENQDYPFETLVEKVVSQRPASGNPLFDTMFVLQNNENTVPQNGEQKKIPRLNITPYGYTNKTSRFDITLEVSDRVKTLWVSIEYRTALFNKATIERFTGYFKQAVSSIRQDPTELLEEIEIIPGEEKKKLIEDFSHTPVHFPGFKDKTIQELFEEQAVRTPDHAALLGKAEGGKDRRAEDEKNYKQSGMHLTYRELNEKSDQLAYLLKEKGVGPDIIVGIMMERSVEMIVGILGILKAGGAYLPIDPGYPGKRIEYMLTGSASKILVTTPGLSKEIEFANDIIFVPTSPHLPFPPSPLPSLHRHLSLAPVTSLVYVIYTSGSTGRPKGVLIQHRSLVNMVRFHREIFGENFQSRISQAASVSFDAMAFEIWPCLLAGGVLCIVDNETRMDPWQLKEWLIKHQITISFQTTRMAQQLLAEQWPKTGTALKALRTAGDRLTVYPTGTYPFRFYNLYGPTEDTIWTTWTEVTVKPRQQSQPPSIGKPVANKQVYILSRSLKLQPVGIAGELCISGVGLARGYLNRTELTAGKFLSVSLTFHRSNKSYRSYISKRIYKTGDLVRWLLDGTIEFLGRVDFQVKIRGFRIELGEIENQLLKHPEIKDAIVIDKSKKSGEKYLCAYFIGEKELEVSPLRHSLIRELPDYMIPSHFIQVNEIPLNPNGKIDRERLPSPGLSASTGYVAPKSDDEKIIARVWKEVLELDRVGADDNFFELGGNSLNIIKINTRLKEVFERDIPVVYMFRYPTVRSFAHYLQQEDYDQIIRRSPKQQKGKTRAKNIRGRKKQVRGI